MIHCLSSCVSRKVSFASSRNLRFLSTQSAAVAGSIDGRHALHNQMNFLNQAGVALETYLIRNHATMSESLFEQMVQDGTACKKDVEKRFYQEVDNQSTLIEIFRRVPLNKAQWVPIVFNLVTCGLCSLRTNVQISTLIREMQVSIGDRSDASRPSFADRTLESIRIRHFCFFSKRRRSSTSASAHEDRLNARATPRRAGPDIRESMPFGAVPGRRWSGVRSRHSVRLGRQFARVSRRRRSIWSCSRPRARGRQTDRDHPDIRRSKTVAIV